MCEQRHLKELKWQNQAVMVGDEALKGVEMLAGLKHCRQSLCPFNFQTANRGDGSFAGWGGVERSRGVIQ